MDPASTNRLVTTKLMMNVSIDPVSRQVIAFANDLVWASLPPKNHFIL